MKNIGLARLGRDAELRYLPDGNAVANLSLAVQVFDKNADNNRGVQWYDATLWGKQAEALTQYMIKGSVHCFTLSDVRIETYEGQNGTGHKLVARVDSVELGPRQDAAPQQGQQPRQQAPAQRQAPQRQQPPARNGYADARGAPQPQRQTPRAASGFDEMDDDIPF